METVVDETLEIAKEYWERRAKEQAEEALQEIEDKVPGRPWDIVLPTSSPIQPIPSFVEPVPGIKLQPDLTNLNDLETQLQPEITDHPAFERTTKLSFLTWVYEELQTRQEEVEEIALFISTSPDGEGLEPEDGDFVDWDNVGETSPPISEKRKILGKEVIDFNPNRALTANGLLVDDGIVWKSLGGETFENILVDGIDNAFPVGDYLNLTPGRYYYKLWTKQKNGQIIKHDFSSFNWYPTTEQKDNPKILEEAKPFPSVSLITPDAYKNDISSYQRSQILGIKIAQKVNQSSNRGGTVLYYEPLTGNWTDSTGNLPTSFDTTKPLVLVTNWTEDSKNDKYNAGTAEALADSVFASLVELDYEYLGGTFSDTDNIYDSQGDLIYTPGGLLNSPFHFISFGAGAVVNTEIIQRVGTTFPKVDDSNQPTQFEYTFPDLQMTTIDPSQGHEFEPEITVWDNVTFADNYYQGASEPFSEFIDGADINISLGVSDATLPEFSLNRAGFTGDSSENEDINKNSHVRAVAWYEGTTDINAHNTFISYPIHRRQGDFSQPEFSSFIDLKPWYVVDHEFGGQIVDDYEDRQWEGNGTGWFYSVLGNGYFQRDSIAVEDRTPVEYDNTAEARQRGDFAIPTLFNGNKHLIEDYGYWELFDILSFVCHP